jgi:hypothetical protein
MNPNVYAQGLLNQYQDQILQHYILERPDSKKFAINHKRNNFPLVVDLEKLFTKL